MRGFRGSPAGLQKDADSFSTSQHYRIMIVLIVGVCGSGKTTIGQALAKKKCWLFEDADSYHPVSNINKMKQGIPLSDQDRVPWLMSLNQVIERWRTTSYSGVLACSALKMSYRNMILHGNQELIYDHEKSCDYLIVHLDGARDLIGERMLKRQGHFMPSELLDSQLAILEPLETKAFTLTIDISSTTEYIINKILEKIDALA